VDYAVNKIIEQRMQLETDGAAHYGYDEIQGEYGLNPNQMTQLFMRLEACEAVGEVLLYENRAAFSLCFKPEFLKQGAPEQQPEPLTQENLAVMYARHMLWCYDQPDGVQADFSGHTLSNLDFSGMSFCGTDFTGATIHQCRMGEASFDGSDFTEVTLRGVAAFQGEFIDAKFNGATLEYCDFSDANLDGADFSQAEIVECDGLDDFSQGPAMKMGG